MASDDDVDVMFMKRLLHLLPKQTSKVGTIFAATGAIHWPMAGCDDKRVAVAAGLLQIPPQPRRLRCVDVGGVQRCFGVHLQEVRGAHAEAVVHAQGVTQ